jgi:hypothetical protein
MWFAAACGSSTADPMASGSASAGETGVTGSPGTDATTGGEGTGASASASATASATASAGSTGVADESEAGDPPVGFDVANQPDAPGLGPCADGKGGGGMGPDFSYLWAANSAQGTISKIDTETVTEIGRYIVRPDSFGSPSRTSVSSSGNVAVANRSGGVTKVYARLEDCEESNGTPGIQTSDGNVALPWGEEECIAWHTPFAYQSQRPVAWVRGVLDPVTCELNNEYLWTAGMSGGQIDVLLLDGETGAVIEQTAVAGLIADSYGLYGGAVDAEGNFWATQLGSANRLVRIDIDDLSSQVWMPPSGPWWYGMTVDSEGYVWMCGDSVARFDPMTETFTTAAVNGYTGCMAEQGEDGLLWMSSFGGGASVIGVNRETLAVEAQWPTPDAYGVSIDFYGYVWTVNNSGAHRVDPATGEVTSYNGLVGAYTYSDMTGYALTYAGGGTPSG